MAKPHTQTCAIAAALNLFGDRWSLLIVREAFYGATRFGEFRKNTGISKTMLSARLARLVENGVLERFDFADRGTNYAYRLTDKGRALDTVLIALLQWADAHVFGDGAEPVIVLDRATGRPLPALTVQGSDGRPIAHADVAFRAGPGADERARRRLARAGFQAAESS